MPHPPAPKRVHYRLINNAVFVPDWDAGLIPPSPRYSQEIYLELAALDLDEPTDIARFVEDFGVLGIDIMSAGSPPFWWVAGWQKYEEESLVPAIFEALRSAGVNSQQSETLVEFRWAATAIRDLLAARRVVAGELDPLDHAWESKSWDYAPQDGTEELPWEDGGAFALLQEGLANGMEAFTPVLIRGAEIPFQDISLYQLCCLELFNHIIEEAPYRRCANEACGRFFVRQRGRAVHGQHRTSGVKYCSAECARAQAQRAYRRRKAAAL